MAESAFVSYTRFDDEYFDGAVTRLCQQLSDDVRALVGRQISIYFDKDKLGPGEEFEIRLMTAIDDATIFLVVMTPSYFNSEFCRKELEYALARQKVIVPLYLLQVPELHEKEPSDGLIAGLRKRQWEDWRELRDEPQDSSLRRKRTRALAESFARLLRISELGEQAPLSVNATSAPVVSAEPMRSDPKRIMVARQTLVDSDPDTLVCSSLSDALEVASAGDRILIHSGTYQESVTIEKPVEVLGQGRSGNVILESTDEFAIRFRATMGRVAGLTLRHAGSTGVTVDIQQGRLDMHDCDVAGEGDSCIAVHHGADPRLHNNNVHDSAGVGIHFHHNGQGTVEDNVITMSRRSNVEVESGANPTMRRNDINNGGEGGIYVHNRGLGTFYDNDINHNNLSNVACASDSSPNFTGNKVHDGRQVGFYAYQGSKAILKENKIYRNFHSGVEIVEDADPRVEGNQIRDGQAGGVWVHHGGLGLFEDNRVYRNEMSGVSVADGSRTVLTWNRIYDNRLEGVVVTDDADCRLEHNIVERNAAAGVKLRGDVHIELRHNKVTNNGSWAVELEEGEPRGVAEGNDLRYNSNGPWSFDEEAAPSRLHRELNL